MLVEAGTLFLEGRGLGSYRPPPYFWPRGGPLEFTFLGRWCKATSLGSPMTLFISGLRPDLA